MKPCDGAVHVCDRFSHPERVIIVVSFCYNVVSVGYITRLLTD